MKNSIEIYWIHHCDDPFCTLGTVEFNCPDCDMYNINYDIWYEEDEYKDGKFHPLNCEHCKHDFEVKYKRYGEFEVK